MVDRQPVIVLIWSILESHGLYAYYFRFPMSSYRLNYLHFLVSLVHFMIFIVDFVAFLLVNVIIHLPLHLLVLG